MQTAKLVELLRGSKKMLVFTGAGISTGSGIPDFRGRKGFGNGGSRFITTISCGRKRRGWSNWDFKLEGWPAFREARPNATHEAIVQLEQAGKVLAVVTQNIDGLHARAGTPAERLVELHGTNSFIECQTCGRRSDPAAHFESFRKTRRRRSANAAGS